MLLFLDYDGTLRAIAGRPENARPDAPLLRLLGQLERQAGLQVAIATGRPISGIRPWLPFRKFWYIGTHGLEICRGFGPRRSLVPTARAKAAIQRICKKLSDRIDRTFTLENKGASLSLHYRLADPEMARRAGRFLRRMVATHQRSGILDVIHGNNVLEVRPHGVQKGLGVDHLVGRMPAGTLPIGIGDDRTDEDMFEAIGGRGISIGVGRRITSAQLRLAGPAAVRRFLRRLCRYMEERRR